MSWLHWEPVWPVRRDVVDRGGYVHVRYQGIDYRPDLYRDLDALMAERDAHGERRAGIAIHGILHAIAAPILRRHIGTVAEMGPWALWGLPASIARRMDHPWLWFEARRRLLLGNAGVVCGVGDLIMLASLIESYHRDGVEIMLSLSDGGELYATDRRVKRVERGREPADAFVHWAKWDFYPPLRDLRQHVIAYVHEHLRPAAPLACLRPRLFLGDDEIDAVRAKILAAAATEYRERLAARGYLVVCEKPEPDVRGPLPAELARVLRRLKIPVVHLADAPARTLPVTVDMGGRLTLRESVAAVAGARLALTADCWLHHAAAAVGTPCIFLDTQTRPSEHIRYPPEDANPGDLLVPTSGRPPCHPCGEMKRCPAGTHACRTLEPARVLRAIRRIQPHPRLIPRPPGR